MRVLYGHGACPVSLMVLCLVIGLEAAVYLEQPVWEADVGSRNAGPLPIEQYGSYWNAREPSYQSGLPSNKPWSGGLSPLQQPHEQYPVKQNGPNPPLLQEASEMKNPNFEESDLSGWNNRLLLQQSQWQPELVPLVPNRQEPRPLVPQRPAVDITFEGLEKPRDRNQRQQQQQQQQQQQVLQQLKLKQQEEALRREQEEKAYQAEQELQQERQRLEQRLKQQQLLREQQEQIWQLEQQMMLKPPAPRPVVRPPAVRPPAPVQNRYPETSYGSDGGDEEYGAEVYQQPVTEADARCPRTDDPLKAVHLAARTCTKFKKCFGGIAYEMSCPPGLEFDHKRSRCDYPGIAKCSAP